MKTKKLHSWRRAIHPERFRTPKVYDNFFFICDDPDCSVKKRFEDIMGKFAKCPRCGNKFVVSDGAWNEYKILCETCKILEGLPQDIINSIQLSVKSQVEDETQGDEESGSRNISNNTIL